MVNIDFLFRLLLLFITIVCHDFKEAKRRKKTKIQINFAWVGMIENIDVFVFVFYNSLKEEKPFLQFLGICWRKTSSNDSRFIVLFDFRKGRNLFPSFDGQKPQRNLMFVSKSERKKQNFLLFCSLLHVNVWIKRCDI